MRPARAGRIRRVVLAMPWRSPTREHLLAVLTDDVSMYLCVMQREVDRLERYAASLR
jgi:hypothetical protein